MYATVTIKDITYETISDDSGICVGCIADDKPYLCNEIRSLSCNGAYCNEHKWQVASINKPDLPNPLTIDGIIYVAKETSSLNGCRGCVANLPDAALCADINSALIDRGEGPCQLSAIWTKKEPTVQVTEFKEPHNPIDLYLEVEAKSKCSLQGLRVRDWLNYLLANNVVISFKYDKTPAEPKVWGDLLDIYQALATEWDYAGSALAFLANLEMSDFIYTAYTNKLYIRF